MNLKRIITNAGLAILVSLACYGTYEIAWPEPVGLSYEQQVDCATGVNKALDEWALTRPHPALFAPEYKQDIEDRINADCRETSERDAGFVHGWIAATAVDGVSK